MDDAKSRKILDLSDFSFPDSDMLEHKSIFVDVIQKEKEYKPNG